MELNSHTGKHTPASQDPPQSRHSDSTRTSQPHKPSSQNFGHRHKYGGEHGEAAERKPKNLDKIIEMNSQGWNNEGFRKRRSYVHQKGVTFEPEVSRKYSDSRHGGYNPRHNSYRNNYRPHPRHPYDHFRHRGGFRKRSYNTRSYFDKQGERKTKSKFNPKYSSRGGKPDYNKSGGFKAPKHLTTAQQKRRHLKMLRKTAAELATGEEGGFVYKPGMISLLRPSTPMNTTQFLSKQKRSSPKIGTKPELNSKEDKDCFSVVEERYNMTEYDQPCGSKTPEPKCSPLHMVSDYGLFEPSHFSDPDQLNVFDQISGTMEGLVTGDLFDADPVVPPKAKLDSPELKSTNEDEALFKATPEAELEPQGCKCGYKGKYETANERIIILERMLRFKNDEIDQLQKKLERQM